MAIIASNADELNQDFWSSLPELPAGLSIERLSSEVVERPGPGGATVLDRARLRWGGSQTELLVLYRARLTGADLSRAGQLLGRVQRDLSLRGQADLLPAVATDVASPRLVDHALRDGLGILDRAGTVAVRAPGLFVHVQGTARVKRPSRAQPFSGRGSRIVRFLLDAPVQPYPAPEVALRTEISYAHAFTVLARLEELGFVERQSPKTGFRLRDPVGLLRAWIESEANTAVRVERFHARSTAPAALARAAAAWRAAGQVGVFTLASALLPDEVHATALPHGAYLSGDVRVVEEALELRRVTPHNFLVLRPEPAVQTAAGGVLLHTRDLPHGPGVALPQLVVDFHRAGGRGPEQAEFLLQRWAAALPLSVGP